MPDELWMEVRDIVQETSVQDHPQEKEMKKAKWMSEALQMLRKEEKLKAKEKKKDISECRVPKNSKER